MTDGPNILAGAGYLMCIGTALLLVLRVAYRNRRPPNEPVYLTLRIIAFVLLCLGWTVAVFILGGRYLGTLATVITLFVAAMVAIQHRANRQRSYLALLVTAAEKQIPLTACDDAMAAETRGLFSRRAARLASNLRAGMPLADAIARSRSVLPPMAELAARVGHFNDSARPAVRGEIVSSASFDPVRRGLSSRLLYLLLLFIAMPLMLALMCNWIIPRLVDVFSELDCSLPSVTQMLISLCEMKVVQGGSIAMVAAAVVLVMAASLAYSGLPTPPLPGTGWLRRRLDRVTIERALAVPAEKKQPLGPMIDLLARYYPSRGVRKRLNVVGKAVASGRNWIDSLFATGLLGRADVAVLSAAQRVGNLGWALREMAESNQRRFIHYLDVLLQVGSLVAILLLAAIVGFVVVALFLPLVQLIMDLT